MRLKPIYLFCFLILTIILLASNSVLADIAVLERIAKAERDVGYVGLRLKTFTNSNGSRTMEEIVIHKTTADSYRKVVSIVGEQKSLTEENEGNRRRDENNRNRDDRSRRSREFRWDRQRSQFSSKEIKLIAKNYDLERRHWGEKIAGYETDLLIIKPKYEGRPTKHIYFARKNGVILRVEDLDAAGILREMFVYTRISFDPEAVEAKWKSFQGEFKPEPRPDQSITLAEAEKILKKNPIQPQYLPPGFQLQSVHKRDFRGHHPIQLKYTDGLLDFYLFETAGNFPGRGDRNRGENVVKIGDTIVHKHQRGPTYAFAWSGVNIHFFLSGAIPDTEMQKVVESIILKKVQK